MKLLWSVLISVLLVSICVAQDQTSAQINGIEKTISPEIVFVPLSAIQPHTITKPFSKKALFSLLAVGGMLGKLLFNSDTITYLELVTRTLNKLLAASEAEAKTDSIHPADTEITLKETLASIAKFLSEQAKDLIE